MKRKYCKYGFRIILLLIIFVVALHVISALTCDHRLQYTEITYSSAKIPPDLNGYVIAFITDTHEITDVDLQKAVSRINSRKVDLLLLGGDFANTTEHMQRGLTILARTATKDGIYGVDGNHDKFWELFPAMEQYGIKPLDNTGLHIKPGFYLAGVQDLWVRRPEVSQALSNVEPVDFVVLLSHNPDVSMQQDMAKVDLMLSGHYHGGHVTFFGLWAPALWPLKSFTPYGQKFMRGWAKGNNNVDVFVSAGTGYRRTPRIFARPQVVFITLKAE